MPGAQAALRSVPLGPALSEPGHSLNEKSLPWEALFISSQALAQSKLKVRAQFPFLQAIGPPPQGADRDIGKAPFELP